jgi:hypothetical protein
MPRPAFFGLVLALTAVFWPWSLGAQQPPLRLLGQFSFESGRTFQDPASGQDTTIGGLSGLAYDAKRGVYYAVSDDRGENQPPRYYTLEIDVGEGGIADVRIVGVTFFDGDAATPGFQPFERGDSDMEEIVLLADDTLLVSSERDRANSPWVRRFALDGTMLAEIAIPERFMPATEPGPDGRPRATRGILPNEGFEGMTVTTAQDALFLVNEDALAQDGPGATSEHGSNVRILRLDLSGAEATPAAEVVYPVEKVFAASTNPNTPSDNGVSAMLWVKDALPQYDLLLMERAFAAGVGNDVNLYGVSLDGATDVRDLDALPEPFAGQPIKKTLLANVTSLGVKPDNLEAVALGPRLPNGRQSLLVMSDDNFSAAGNSPQINQFLLFEITPD